MKINEETTVSEEQVLFNKLNWENQQMILRIMRCLQPCELSYEVEEEKKIPEKLDLYEETQNIIRENNYKLVYHDIHKCIVSLECKYNQLLDYLKSKGE